MVTVKYIMLDRDTGEFLGSYRDVDLLAWETAKEFMEFIEKHKACFCSLYENTGVQICDGMVIHMEVTT